MAAALLPGTAPRLRPDPRCAAAVLAVALVLGAQSAPATRPATRPAPPQIAHLSDPHVGAAAGLPHLRAVLAELGALRPALVVVTGDLTEKGAPEEFDRYFAAVEQFTRETGIQVLSCPGNHDVRWNAAGRARITRHAGPLPRFARVGDLGVIAMDATLSFAQHGHLGTLRLRAVEAILQRETGVRDWVLALHHPPGASQFVDDGAELRELLDRWPVSLLLVGHGHAHQIDSFAGVTQAMAIGVMNPRFGYRLWQVEPEALIGRALVRGGATDAEAEPVRVPRRRAGAGPRPASAPMPPPATLPTGVSFRRFAGTFLSAPLPLPECVVAATEEGAVRWLDPADLTPQARADVTPPVLIAPFLLGDAVVIADGTPALRRFTKGGAALGQVGLPALVTAAARCSDHEVLLCLSDGTLWRWSQDGAPQQLARLGAQVRATPLVLRDRVLLAPWDRTVRALALADGRELGRQQVHASFYYSAATATPLAWEQGAVFFGHDQRLRWVDRAAAAMRELPFDGVQPAYAGGAAWRGDQIVVGSMNGVLAVLDLGQGRTVQRIALGAPVFDSTPLVVGDEAFVGTMGGELVRVDLGASVVRGRVALGGYVLADPVLGAGAVFAVSTTGVVVGWRR